MIYFLRSTSVSQSSTMNPGLRSGQNGPEVKTSEPDLAALVGPVSERAWAQALT